ncbi:MAG: ABC-2 family transporter protein [Rhizobacter sp.]|nr:ABC-2 family transporter protein [Chlorobiales bacterium]
MKKYFFVFRTSLQRFVEYRSEIVLDIGGKVLLPIFVQGVLWSSVTATAGGTLAGYTLGGLITYVVFSIIIYNLMNVGFVEREIANAIREGDLNKFLSKPVDFMLYYFFVFLADNLPVFAASLVLGGLAAAFGVVAVQPQNFAFGITAIILAMYLSYIIAFLIAMLAFWMEEVWTLFVMKNMSFWFLTGQIIPLDLFPPEVQETMKFLPFGYLAYFPTKILTNRLAPPEILFGLTVICAWIFFLTLLYKLFWDYALRKYGAFGG